MSANQPKGYSDNLAMTGDKGGALGVGDLGDEASLDPLAGTGQRKKFNGGSLVLVGVIVMALAGLFFMRTLSKVSASSGGKNSNEDKVKKFLDSRGNKTGPDPAVVFDIGSSYTDRQVPLTDVQRNPFILPGEGMKLPDQPDTTDRGAAKRLTDRKLQFEKAYAKLALKTIMMGSNPMASLNGRIVRRGDEITIDPESVTFRITEITADSLSLSAEDTSLGLQMNYSLELKRDF